MIYLGCGSRELLGGAFASWAWIDDMIQIRQHRGGWPTCLFSVFCTMLSVQFWVLASIPCDMSHITWRFKYPRTCDNDVGCPNYPARGPEQPSNRSVALEHRVSTFVALLGLVHLHGTRYIYGPHLNRIPPRPYSPRKLKCIRPWS